MRVAINAAIIKEGELLIVRKNITWILPGGKPENNETDLECLIRESKEELKGIELTNFRFYKSFEGKTPHKGDVLKAHVYFADMKTPYEKPNREINEAVFTSKPEEYLLSDITSKIVLYLRNDKYL
jgi:8-oxo-dGTP diphosphatase